MNKRIPVIAILASIISSTAAHSSKVLEVENSKHSNLNHWDCYTASDAQERKNKVENGILPQVVFDGDMKPSNIEKEMAISKIPTFSVAIIHNGKLDWSATWGRLKRSGAQANCSSLFQAGSLAV